MSSEVLSMREPLDPTAPERALLLSNRYIEFGPFRIDQQKQEVTRNGSRLKLQGKVYQILLSLLEKPGEVVTREELRMRLWPADTHVNYDANVNTTVNKLRQALGDSSDNPLYVETIPRKGYCLLVQPEISDKFNGSHFVLDELSADTAQNSAAKPGAFLISKSDARLVLTVIGLILLGMFLGAGIMRLWITHVVPVSPYPVVLLLSRFLAKALL
jgi:DNA-binding winged helix-turn-helix (wHTH) protein